MEKPRFKLAAKRAKELLRDAHVKQPPVPVDEIAEKLSLVVVYEAMPDDVSGFLHRDGKENGVIGVHSLHAVTRQRFTVAHEIGHFLLHSEEVTHVDKRFAWRDDLSSRAVDVKEIEANTFAAELLMPEAFLLRDLRNEFLDFEAEELPEELARRYKVSVQAMTIRLSRIGRQME